MFEELEMLVFFLVGLYISDIDFAKMELHFISKIQVKRHILERALYTTKSTYFFIH